jgi:hypothetical protein
MKTNKNILGLLPSPARVKKIVISLISVLKNVPVSLQVFLAENHF